MFRFGTRKPERNPERGNPEPGTDLPDELTDPERTSTIGVFVAIAAREIAIAINERWCR
jgi:hypothetical protein